MRVALYARVSTLDQNPEMQIRELKEYCSRCRYEIAFEYVDHGISGKTSNRPELKKLLRDANLRKFDKVLVWKLDRFGRSLKDLITHINDLTEIGISFVSLKDNIDLSTSHGKLMLGIFGSLAEFEADIIRERVKSGIANAKSKGKILGRPKCRDDIKIRELRATGMTIRAVAKATNVSTTAVQRALKAL